MKCGHVHSQLDGYVCHLEEGHEGYHSCSPGTAEGENVGELHAAIKEILSDASDSHGNAVWWCSCYEGDMYDEFPHKVEDSATRIITLLRERDMLK